MAQPRTRTRERIRRNGDGATRECDKIVVPYVKLAGGKWRNDSLRGCSASRWTLFTYRSPFRVTIDAEPYPLSRMLAPKSFEIIQERSRGDNLFRDAEIIPRFPRFTLRRSRFVGRIRDKSLRKQF